MGDDAAAADQPPPLEGGEEAPAKSKGELRRERAAKQAAERAAKESRKQAAQADRARGGPPVDAAPAAAAPPKPAPKPAAAAAAAAPRPPRQRSGQPSAVEEARAVELRKRDRRLKELSQLHPDLIRLGLQYQNHEILGGNARAAALVSVFRTLIADTSRRQAPVGVGVSWALPSSSQAGSEVGSVVGTEREREMSYAQMLRRVIDRAVSHLNSCRRISQSMGSVTSFVKAQINRMPEDIPDEEMQKRLDELLKNFVEQYIVAADKSIAHRCVDGSDTGANPVLEPEIGSRVAGGRADPKLVSGDVVLTFGRSNAIEWTFRLAKSRGLTFEVVVVDSRPLNEGKHLAMTLSSLGIRVTYCHLNALSAVLPRCNKVFAGASTMLSNGSLVSRMGTAMICVMARNARLPVLCFCETYKFADKVWLGSLVNNEDGDPTDLYDLGDGRSSPLAGLDNSGETDFRVFNKMYDVTPASCVDMVITETGCYPPSCVPVLVRERQDRIDMVTAE
eukprot:TRINITY_DN24403_c0_g2_i1.p1 TRINITY_DN24403_c0_g2~~TRINITY_DN24403_c0_g2_i1.p1  ORF type:complete len:526 (+),score=209.30 TRINITY_DN24403_c0_g2_i1:61-1578(+)